LVREFEGTQYGNHSGGVGFGVASGRECSRQTGASQPFLFDSGGPSRTLEAPTCVRGRGPRSARLSKATGRGGRRYGMGTGGIVAGAIAHSSLEGIPYSMLVLNTVE